MNLQQLRVLVAVLERQSFTLAARDLAMTQPAVSQHIRALERYCRMRLVERSRGRIVPTPAGADGSPCTGQRDNKTAGELALPRAGPPAP